jgi:hypothetical protein
MRLLCLWLVTALPCCIHAANRHSPLLLQSQGNAGGHSSQPDARPFLGTAAIIRGIDELAISESAMRSARDNSKFAQTMQQQLVAQQAVEGSKAPFLKVSAKVPEARAQMLKVRQYAMEAQQSHDHAEAVKFAFLKLKKDAALVARKAAVGWIAADATKTAEKSALDHDAFTAKKGDKIAAAVAKAAEPYHLALLRNQKFCAETYAKAKTSQQTSLKLVADAKRLALKAQELQMNGLAVQAVESHGMASGMMIQAEDLRQWATKLYNQANTACSTAGGYTSQEQQAAANAAATVIVNAPMKLPKGL